MELPTDTTHVVMPRSVYESMQREILQLSTQVHAMRDECERARYAMIDGNLEGLPVAALTVTGWLTAIENVNVKVVAE